MDVFRFLLRNALAALVRFAVSALLFGVCLFLGFSPENWVAGILGSPPPMLIHPLFRVAIVLIGVAIILGTFFLDTIPTIRAAMNVESSHITESATGIVSGPPKAERLTPELLDSVAETAERVMVDVTPEFLTGLYKGHTTVQGDKLAADYMGKWMNVSGPLDDVFPLAYTGTFEWYKEVEWTFQVTFGNRGFAYDLSTVFARFNKDWFDRIQLIQPGNNIFVVGQIVDIDGIHVDLWNCELVDAAITP